MRSLPFLLLAALTFASPSAAQSKPVVRIELRDGSSVVGTLESLSQGVYTVRVAGETRTIRQADIKRVRFGEGAPEADKKTGPKPERGPLVLAMTRTAKTHVGELIAETADGITIHDLKTNRERVLVRGDLLRFEKKVSDDKAVRYAGLAPLLAWKIHGLQISPKKLRVAVLPIDGAAGLSEEVTTGLVSRKVSVVERAHLTKVLAELRLQRTRVFDSATAQRIGKQLGASAVLCGKVVESGRRADAHVRLIRVETGEIVVAVKQRLKSKPGASKNAGKKPRKARRRSMTSMGRRGLPSWLAGQGTEKAKVGKDGVRFDGREVARSKKGNYLSRDFTFEVLITPLFNGDNYPDQMLVGIGEAYKPYAHGMPEKSIYLRIAHQKGRKGEVAFVSVDTGIHGEKIGRLTKKGGNHRVIITKRGKRLTLAIDVDDDGPSPDDIEHTISDLPKYAEGYLHRKNTYLFIGGGGGVFKKARLGR